MTIKYVKKITLLLQLHVRTGYSQLNDYKQKLGQVESNRCECGEVENTEHFLLGQNFFIS